MDISIVSWLPMLYSIFTAIQTIASAIVNIVLLPLKIFGYTLPGVVIQLLVFVAVVYIGYKLLEVAKNVFLVAVIVFIILLILSRL